MCVAGVPVRREVLSGEGKDVRRFISKNSDNEAIHEIHDLRMLRQIA